MAELQQSTINKQLIFNCYPSNKDIETLNNPTTSSLDYPNEQVSVISNYLHDVNVNNTYVGYGKNSSLFLASNCYYNNWIDGATKTQNLLSGLAIQNNGATVYILPKSYDSNGFTNKLSFYLGYDTNKFTRGYIDTLYSGTIISSYRNSSSTSSDFNRLFIAMTSNKGGSTSIVHSSGIRFSFDVFKGSSTTSTLRLYLDANYNNSKIEFYPDKYANNDVMSATLGKSTNKWETIYATTGTINTSNRSDKEDIHYLDEKQLKTRTLNTITSFSTTDIINFIEKLNPCTFVYKDTKDEPVYTDVQSALNSNNTEMVQLGLIADDIKDEPLFNYIGATMKYQDEIEPEEKDENGNIIKEAVYEEKTTLGLKPIPLAVAALTCCKYLLQKVNELENK